MTERISSVKENSFPSQLGAILLCGGESRRMGTPKAWLDWKGQPLLEYMVSILSQVSKEIVVVAAPGQDLPELP
ncbi:MAG: NTP transferase domain-containing protein, partial [Planctomycetota bacterium]|nr:NTP transferase domain-containing protein [Planctomycetota bacterium]